MKITFELFGQDGYLSASRSNLSDRERIRLGVWFVAWIYSEWAFFLSHDDLGNISQIKSSPLWKSWRLCVTNSGGLNYVDFG
jgi:hypothetical protein